MAFQDYKIYSKAPSFIWRLLPELILQNTKQPASTVPEMDGLAMIAALDYQFPDMEVSILTGYRDFEYAREAIRLGVTRFLLKPSNMSELEEAIGTMCENLKKKGIWEDMEHPAESASGSFIVKNALAYIEKNYAQKLTLCDVAEQVGFSDLAHFSRVFKKQEGVSANEYRNSILGK